MSMRQKGFTLVEMLVSVAIFSVVMLIALGALLAISEADRRAETQKSVINNLNFSLDSMSRAIRTGTNYSCGPSLPVSGTPTPTDCTTPPGGSTFAFRDAQGRTLVYKFETSNGTLCGQVGSIGCIVRSVDGGSTFAALTAPEVVISQMSFYTVGAPVADATQPKVTMLLSGRVIVTPKVTSDFNLQVSVTQRLYDQ